MLAVTDTGHRHAARRCWRSAFEPFFTTKREGHGTGLGLSQVYGFVKQSGGHVKIYSEIDQGTTIKIYLPRHLGEGEDAPEAAATQTPKGRRDELILLVEDEAAVREQSLAMLQELGYGVIAASDGPAALKALEANPKVRLLFTDVGLPGGMNGRQVADAALAMRPGLKVLFTTGYARNAIIHHGRLDAGLHLLTKPFAFNALAAKLRELMDA
jgi:CheY-like chemotaxis protein